jgi:hypothetical protein
VDAEAVLTIDRSLLAVTEVVSVSVLFVIDGSLVADVTVAVLLIEPPLAGAVTEIVIAGAAPTASVARVQVTVPEALLQVQPVPVADTNVTPAGSVSETETFAAGLGPAFATLRV